MGIARIGLAAVLAVVVSAAVALPQTRAAGRPNLLFILTDQQRQDTLGAYGNWYRHSLTCSNSR